MLKKDELLRRRQELSATKQALFEKRLQRDMDTSGGMLPKRGAEWQELAPTSFAQQRLWFLDQLEPGSPIYHIFYVMRLQGRLNFAAFTRSLNEIIRRHEVLRTTFVDQNGTPVQHIQPASTLALPYIDLSIEAEQTAKIDQLLRQAAQQPFNLQEGPLLHAQMIRLSEQEHMFILVFHHCVSDDWSMSIFNRELTVLYAAYCMGDVSPLSDLPAQYADYAVWQRQWLQGKQAEEQRSYWRRQLEDAPPVLELPTDHIRPAVQSFHGETLTFVLPRDLTQALRRLSYENSVTLFMTLLAAFQVLLARYTGQEDIVVGSPIANRTFTEVENMIGFFVNTLVLRTLLTGKPTFREVLKRVRNITLDAYDHQDIPFEQLVEMLQPDRKLSHNPLFQVMFALQNAPKAEVELQGLTLRPVRFAGTTAQFDLSLLLWEEQEGLLGDIEYSTDLFERGTIEQFITHFKVLVENIVAQPDVSIWELELLTPTECQQVLREWNATRIPFAHDDSIEQLFATQAARTPDTIAVVFEESQLTYAELDRRAEQLARILQSQGVGPEVPVGICLERSLEMIVALFGILKAGGAYVPLDPAYPGERLAFMIQQTRMRVLLTQNALLKRLPSLDVSMLCLDTNWSARVASLPTLVRHVGMAKHLASIIYTSGSTGQPKGVAGEQRSLVNFTQAAAQLLDVKPGDRVLQFASLSFDASSEEIYPCLTHGGTLVLRTETMLQSPADFLRTCQAWGVTVLDLPTAYWHELAATPDALAVSPDLRLVIIGGEQARAERLAVWQHHVSQQVRLLNTYGPTEATVVATAHEVRPPERQGACEAAMIGRAIANVEVYVLDHWGQPVPIGVPGELCLGGEGIARGYLGHPVLTAERFVPHSFSDRPGARLYRTGDLVRLHPDGLLEYRGRVDRQVKLRGFRIELAEIESALARHPGVREAAVLLQEDTQGDGRLVAYVVGQPAQSVSGSELRSFLQQHLPSYMLPASFVWMEAMPQTPNGKLDRRALPMMSSARSDQQQIYEAPRNALEEVLADLWSQVLGREEPISIQADFFALGGHSLLVTRMLAQVRAMLQVEVPLRVLFETPTIAGMADFLLNEDDGDHQ